VRSDWSRPCIGLKQALPYSPLVEWGEDDGRLFLNVTGTSRLFGPPMDVAWRMRKGVRRDLGMDPIWSVAPNKLVAKAATRIVKPDGEYIVAGGEEADVLAPCPSPSSPASNGGMWSGWRTSTSPTSPKRRN
jgi:DNA polymerase-4